MNPSNTIFITDKKGDKGKNIVDRILIYLEMFVQKNNDIKELDRILNVKDEDEKFDKEDRKKYVIMNGYDMLNNKKELSLIRESENNFERTNYPLFVQMSQENYDLLKDYNSGLIKNNEILGMQISIKEKENNFSKNRRKKYVINNR